LPSVEYHVGDGSGGGRLDWTVRHFWSAEQIKDWPDGLHRRHRGSASLPSPVDSLTRSTGHHDPSTPGLAHTAPTRRAKFRTGRWRLDHQCEEGAGTADIAASSGASRTERAGPAVEDAIRWRLAGRSAPTQGAERAVVCDTTGPLATTENRNAPVCASIATVCGSTTQGLLLEAGAPALFVGPSNV
jgi:hypothetical protein